MKMYMHCVRVVCHRAVENTSPELGISVTIEIDGHNIGCSRGHGEIYLFM